MKLASVGVSERVNFQSSSILNWFIKLRWRIKSFSTFASVVYKKFYYQGKTNLVTLSGKTLNNQSNLSTTTKLAEYKFGQNTDFIYRRVPGTA